MNKLVPFLGLGVFAAAVLATIAWYGAIAFVAVHFIAKFW